MNTYLIITKQKYINVLYLDFVNQYKWVLSQPITFGEFVWVANVSMVIADFIINKKENSVLALH